MEIIALMKKACRPTLRHNFSGNRTLIWN